MISSLAVCSAFGLLVCKRSLIIRIVVLIVPGASLLLSVAGGVVRVSGVT